MKFISNIKNFAAAGFSAVVGFFGRFTLPALTATNAATAVGAVALSYAAFKHKDAIFDKAKQLVSRYSAKSADESADAEGPSLVVEG